MAQGAERSLLSLRDASANRVTGALIPRPLLPKLGVGELEAPLLSLGVGFRVGAERRSTNIPRKILFTQGSERWLAGLGQELL